MSCACRRWMDERPAWESPGLCSGPSRPWPARLKKRICQIGRSAFVAVGDMHKIFLILRARDQAAFARDAVLIGFRPRGLHVIDAPPRCQRRMRAPMRHAFG